MTNKDFFRLMIKLFGLYQFLLLIFTSLPRNLQLLFNDFFSISSIITLILITLFILAVYYVFVKKPDLIIDFFKLDKGFDNNEITVSNLNSDTILQIGMVLIGGFLIVDNFGYFISSFITYFKISYMSENLESLKIFESLILGGANLILGFCLIIYRKQIAKKFQ
ncbi:hypothetical protein [Cloacibacterium normanense]|uniref:hypothetical protein n=1 Tax=Cloacibacterium normanense TaxID=237258 RepID=UPI00391C44CD